MNAILLAGGFGKRLRPITNNIPKCLVEVRGKPLLEHWLIKLKELNCNSVLINSHYLADQVQKFLDNFESSLNIKLTYEKELLGTAGTLIDNLDFFNDDEGLLIHADNFTKNNLRSLVNSHKSRPKKALLTMLTFNTEKPKQCGIVETNEEGMVSGFYEKSDEFHGYKANGALYMFDRKFLSWVSKNHKKANDFSLDILPNLIGKIYTHHINDLYVDIGTPESLFRVNECFTDL